MPVFRKLLFILLSFVPIFCWSQKPDYVFKRINANHGLSSGFVRTVMQDHKGYMWFGTTHGLNKYDGYEITTYKNIPGDSASLVSSDIPEVFEDSYNQLWIGTIDGICRLNRETDNFAFYEATKGLMVDHIVEDKEKNVWISADAYLYRYNRKRDTFTRCNDEPLPRIITRMFIDSKDTFWISTEDGMYIFDRQNFTFARQRHIDIRMIRVIYEDSRGNFWIGSSVEGLKLYDRASQTVSTPNFIDSLDVYAVFSFMEDEEGNLWIGSENRGLFIFDTEKRKLYRYQTIKGNDESLSFNTINDMCLDSNGHAWLGIFMGGVNYVTQRKFAHIHANNPYDKQINSNNILSFCEDQDGNIWIGTDGGGLNFYNRKNDTYTYFLNEPGNPASITTNYVTGVVEDKEGNIWAGLWAGGIARYDKETQEFTRFRHDENDPENTLRYDGIINLYIDKRSNLWVSTLHGLDRFDLETHEIEHLDFGSFAKNYVRNILEDSRGNLWLCTTMGLLLYNRDTKEFTSYTHSDSIKTSISNSKVFYIYEDSKRRLWVCTAGGINYFDIENNAFTAYQQKDGLPDNAVFGALEDRQGNLWLSTNNGICRFNPETKAIKNFDVNDGLQGNQFREHTLLKLRTGEMLFGGTNGYNIIDPAKISDNPFVPPVVFTGFKIFNEDVPVGENSPLSRHISQAKSIALPYHASVFSFEFSALSYELPEKNRFAYMMEGFDEKWIYCGDIRSATYTNLDPGRYTFRVKAANNDGLWNETGASIGLIITPPYWQTWWFKILAVIAITGLAIAWYQTRVKNIKKYNEVLENQVRERTHDLSLANRELEIQKEELKAKRKTLESLYIDIKDSIRAAEVIQQSIFPSVHQVKTYLPESFIFNKPKDVIGGDFYWFDVVGDKLVMAVVDCTGHGVSGAFMAIIGQNQLNQAIHAGKTSLSAANILNHLNDGIIEKLHQQDADDLTRNGMDIALCIIDKKKNRLQFAGANNSLYIQRKGSVIQYKANKFPIGMLVRGAAGRFDNHIIDLEKGDACYMFSDGYADQIGGDNGHEKFMYSRLRELITNLAGKKMAEQHDIFESTFTTWKGTAEQLDDVLVVGFKV